MGIRQLAHELQLSIGTVSRALNDRPDVNDETRARVKEAAMRAGLRAEPVRAAACAAAGPASSRR